MLDRVREALFSTLGPALEGARVLDLFAGTGSLGLESLSRGAAFALLVERHRPTIRILRENVEQLGLGQRARVLDSDALDPRSWRDLDGGGPRYDVVFLDPPYPLLDERGGRAALFSALQSLVRQHLAAEGVLVLHAPRGRVRVDELGEGVSARVREYGTHAIWYVRASAEARAG